ncbi:MAG: polysaccharide deacetylase family protein, partial [Verrucomicrobiales bacterium]
MNRRHLLKYSPAAVLGLKACSPNDQSTPTPSAPPNPQYRPPAYTNPAVRNPNINLPSQFGNIEISHSRGPSSQPFVAMTFDDGPHPQNTPRLLDMLRQRNIKATFYVIGGSVDRYPHIVRRTVAEGHEIGNHTYTHRKLTTLGNSEVSRELQRTNDAIARACGVRPRTMRPPYGALNQSQRAYVYQQFGTPTILWSVDPQDWRRPGASVVTSRILSGTNNGAIILAHDLHSSTIDAMPATLDGLLRKGYKFITVSQMLAMKG